jgi:hypothetical protein
MTEIDTKERTRNYLSQIKGSFVYRVVGMVRTKILYG